MIITDLDKGAMVNNCLARKKVSRKLPWILARVPWLRTLGDFTGVSFL